MLCVEERSISMQFPALARSQDGEVFLCLDSDNPATMTRVAAVPLDVVSDLKNSSVASANKRCSEAIQWLSVHELELSEDFDVYDSVDLSFISTGSQLFSLLS